MCKENVASYLFIKIPHPPSEILPAGKNLLIQKVNQSNEIISAVPFTECYTLLFQTSWTLPSPSEWWLDVWSWPVERWQEPWMHRGSSGSILPTFARLMRSALKVLTQYYCREGMKFKAVVSPFLKIIIPEANVYWLHSVSQTLS